jgi:hypothetical protein
MTRSPVHTDTGARLVPAAARRQMLRIAFRSLSGDAPTLMLASCLRFCADGTLRGADNCVVARSEEGCWKVGGKLHRDLDCDGPVRLRFTVPGRATPVEIGPFPGLRTNAGVFFSEATCLNVLAPGRLPRRAGDCTQLTLIWDGAHHGQA